MSYRQRHRQRNKLRGLSLLELLVSVGLCSVIGLFILEIYLNAQTEFDHTAGTINMSQRARLVTAKIVPLLTSSLPLTNGESGVVIPTTSSNPDRQFYQVDFLCSKYVVQAPNRASRSGWNNTAKYWVDDQVGLSALHPGNRYTYEPDDINSSAENTIEPSAYRYRFVWRPFNDVIGKTALGTSDTTSTINIKERQLAFERLETNGYTNPYDPWFNTAGIGIQRIPSTRPKIIANKISLFTVQRSGNALELRIRMYNIDPDIWRAANTGTPAGYTRFDAILDDTMMRRVSGTAGGHAAAGTIKFQAYDLVTSIPLPAATIK